MALLDFNRCPANLSGGAVEQRLALGGANLADEAWQQFAAEAKSGQLAPLASILQAVVERRDLPLLADRFIDGCAWYGDAAREPSPAAAAVKFVTVMERLLWAGGRARRRRHEARIRAIGGAVLLGGNLGLRGDRS